MKRIVQIILGILLFPAMALAHQGHEHTSNVPTNVKWGLQGLQEISNVHPLFVHFPIALLLTAIAFYFIGLLFRKEEFYFSAKWVFYAGVLSTVVTVLTGLQAANTVPHGGGNIHQTLMAHQYTGFGILGISFILAIWLLITKKNIPSKGRPSFFIALVLLAALITQQADFGGRLVFLNGVGVKKQSITKGAS